MKEVLAPVVGAHVAVIAVAVGTVAEVAVTTKDITITGTATAIKSLFFILTTQTSLLMRPVSHKWHNIFR